MRTKWDLRTYGCAHPWIDFLGSWLNHKPFPEPVVFLLSIMWKITILLCLNFILVGEIPMFDSIPNVEGRVFPVIALGIDSIFPAATMVKFQVGPRWSWMIGDQPRFFVGSSPAINEYRYGKFTICRSFPHLLVCKLVSLCLYPL